MFDEREILKGIIDLHVHAGPSVANRAVDAADMLKEAIVAGYRGFLVKDQQLHGPVQRPGAGRGHQHGR